MNQADKWMVTSLLDGLYDEHMIGFGVVHLTPFTLIEGCAKGADSIANWWGRCAPTHSHNENLDQHFDVTEFVHLPFPADWNRYGRAAGPIRNRQMLTEGKPDLVVAFHDDIESSKGTKDMVTIAEKAGVYVYVMGRFKRPVVELF